MFLEVALPLSLQQTFYYRCLGSEFSQIQLGQRILVPFNNRKLTGYVVNKHAQLPSDFPAEASIKEVLEILDKTPLISPELFRLGQWVSDYYFASLGEVLRACLPPRINLRSKKKLSITSKGMEVLEDRSHESSLSQTEKNILHVLAGRESLNSRQVETLAGCKIRESDLRKLACQNFVQFVQVVEGKVLSERQQLVVALRADYREALEQTQLTSLQISVICALEASVGPVLISELQRQYGASYSSLRSMERKGIIRLWKDRLKRDPLKDL